VYYDAT
jgi:hypothetical protein